MPELILSPSTKVLAGDLMKSDDIKLKQIREIAEWFGFETRNKYQLCDKNDSTIGYAAEQQKGFLGFIMRQFLGHWRSFDIHLFNVHRQHALTLRHPFRWFFQKLEIMDESEKRVLQAFLWVSLLS